MQADAKQVADLVQQRQVELEAFVRTIHALKPGAKAEDFMLLANQRGDGFEYTVVERPIEQYLGSWAQSEIGRLRSIITEAASNLCTGTDGDLLPYAVLLLEAAHSPECPEHVKSVAAAIVK